VGFFVFFLYFSCVLPWYPALCYTFLQQGGDIYAFPILSGKKPVCYLLFPTCFPQKDTAYIQGFPVLEYVWPFRILLPAIFQIGFDDSPGNFNRFF